MADANHYVPILKTKAGECRALKDLNEETWRLLTPLLEVQSPPWDYTVDAPAKTTAQHVVGVQRQLTSNLPDGASVYLDADSLPPEDTMPDGSQPLEFLSAGLVEAGVQVVPVVGFERPDAYMDAAARLAKAAGAACIRVEAEDLPDMPATLSVSLRDLLSRLELAETQCVLLLDFAEIPANAVRPVTLAAASVIGSLDHAETWDQIVFAGTGMPQTVADLSPGVVSTVPRSEWVVWRALVAQARVLPRVPCFGDYAVTHPELPSVDPRLMKMSAKMRYTVDDDWLVARSRNVRDYGYEQAHELCALISERDEFRGREYSAGDTFIEDCAARRGGPGSATTWVTAGTSHHLEFVARQVASYPVPSVAV